MSNNGSSRLRSSRLICLLGLITFALVWLMPLVPYSEAHLLFKAVSGCSAVAAGLICFDKRQ